MKKSTTEKIGLVLAGGGITGAVYEIGALRAIDDLLLDRTVNDFDIYVGTSAGAFVATLLANGQNPENMLMAIDGSSKLVEPIQPHHLFGLNYSDLLQWSIGLPQKILSAWWQYLQNVNDMTLFDLLWSLSNVIPSGLYDTMILERYTRQVLETIVKSNQFHRYGRTSQCIPIDMKGLRYRAGLSVAEKNYSLRPLGRSDRQMGPDLIQANRFEITIRDLGEQEAVRACSETRSVTQQGYPNYFDEQRFGSYDPVQGFIAEKLLKHHYNGALKIYLTSIRREDKRETKERKQFLLAHWGQWQTCLKRAETPFEKASFFFLAHTPKGFIPLLQRMSREEMSLFIAAYQSFLWNELLQEDRDKACQGGAGAVSRRRR